MSKIVTPVPPLKYDEIKRSEPDKSWWRLRLRANADGHLMTCRFGGGDGSIETATWAEYEIYDGADDWLDAGLDKPTVTAIRMISPYPGTTFVDILHGDSPTASPLWERLAPPGYPHPDDIGEISERTP